MEVVSAGTLDSGETLEVGVVNGTVVFATVEVSVIGPDVVLTGTGVGLRVGAV